MGIKEAIERFLGQQEVMGVVDTKVYQRAVQEVEREIREKRFVGEKRRKAMRKFLRSSGAEGLLKDIRRAWEEGDIITDVSYISNKDSDSYARVFLTFDYMQLEVYHRDYWDLHSGPTVKTQNRRKEQLSIAVADFPWGLSSLDEATRPAKFEHILPGTYFVLHSRSMDYTYPDEIYCPARYGSLYVPLTDRDAINKVRDFLKEDFEERLLGRRLPKDLRNSEIHTGYYNLSEDERKKAYEDALKRWKERYNMKDGWTGDHEWHDTGESGCI